MNILILGGDGYLGWPTAMYFSKKNYQVTVVDNYFRRKSSKKSNVATLYETPDLINRAKIWYELTGNEIKVVIGDLQEPDLIRSLFNGKIQYDWSVNHNFSGIPDTVIHFAEQPSAPFSLIDHNHANFTLKNNLIVTNNLMWSVKDYSRDTHVIKLGTMGEYGTPNIDIEEGWIEINHKGRADKFLFPRQASSIYHTSKIMDTDLIWFGVRTWDLKVTDLMQGPVYGIETDESVIDERLDTIFNYDEIFGTVINRFIIQALCSHPLTIYGSGNQIRGYLNIKDTLQCIYHATINPSEKGELRIFNQIMETLSVNEIADKIKKVSESMGYKVSISNIKNPRKESEEHYYNPKYQGLIDLGVKPNYFTDDVIRGILIKAENYKNNINEDVIFNGIKW